MFPPFIVLVSIASRFAAYSIPTVDFESTLNVFFVNLERRFVFPTPESPTMTTVFMVSKTVANLLNMANL